MFQKIIFILLFICNLTSCKVALPYDNTLNKIGFNAKINSISFKDLRNNVAQLGEDIKLPTISTPNQLREFVPALLQSHEMVMKQVILENLSENAMVEYDFLVEIVEAKKIFSATWTAEKEEVKIHLKVTISNKNIQRWSEASGEYVISSFDANNKKFEMLYLLALKNVTYKAIEMLHKQKIPQ